MLSSDITTQKPGSGSDRLPCYFIPTMNYLNNFIAKLRAFTVDGGRKSWANATRLKAVSGVCLTFGVQNLNPQQEKALGQFLSGSDVFVNLPTGYAKSLIYQMAPLVAIELLKQHSHFPNECIVVCKIYLKKKSETLKQSTRKNYHFTFDMYG